MVAPILDRLRRHQEFEANRDVALPLRGPTSALAALGLLMEATQNTATAGTGAGLALNAKLNPFMRLGINDNAGAMSGTRLANEAATGFAQGRGNLIQRAMAANEAAARGDERGVGLLNAATDPTNLTVMGGPLAALGGRAGKLGQLLRIADEAQGLLLNRAGGAALKRLGIATDRGLRPEITSFLRDRAAGAGLGAAAGASNTVLTGGIDPLTGERYEGDEQRKRILQGALAGGAAGGLVGRRNVGKSLGEFLGRPDAGGFMARRAAAQLPRAGADESLGMGMSPAQVARMRARRGAAQPSAVPELADLVGEESAQELLAMFSGGKSPLSKEMLSRTIMSGRQNKAADNFAELINKHWDRAKAGQFSAHDIISAYVPAILSQRRGAMSPETTLFNPARLEQLGTKYPELVTKIRGNLTQGGTDAGLHRPEDLAAYMMLHTDEGRDLGSALRYGDPQAIQTAIDNFSAIWPDAGFFPGSSRVEGPELFDPELGALARTKPSKAAPEGRLKFPQGPDINLGERGALVQAGKDDVFGSMAEFINRAVMRGGMSGDEIAQVMRDWTAGVGNTDTPVRDLVRGDVDPRLPSKNNWGAVIDRIANGKSGFLTTNLGGPSATFDVRVEDAMRPGSTIEDYQRALNLMFPGDDPGLQHHKFWDAMSYDPYTDTAGQTPHGGIAELMGAVGEGFRYPSPMNAGINPEGLGRALGPLAERLRRTTVGQNLDRFMEGAHPLLKNADGTPKRFFHGGLSGDFDQFDVPVRPGDIGTGIYFTENPKYAGMYASGGEREFTGSDNYRPATAGGNIKPVYVNLKNPYIIGSNPELDQLINTGLGKPADARATEILKAQGYDGVILQGGMFTGGPGKGPRNYDQIEELVVFDPSAIKSATGNRGTYDPNEPSMLRAGLDPGAIDDLAARFKDRFVKPADVSGVKTHDVPGPLEGQPKRWSPQQNQVIDAVMAMKKESAPRDADNLRKLSLGSYATRQKTADGFDELWQTLVENIRNSRVLEVGYGSDIAEMARTVESGLGRRTGFDPDLGDYDDLIKRKHGRVRDNMSREEVQKFVDIEGRAHANLGVGDPLVRDETGRGYALNPESAPPMYASYTEGEPSGMEMGGTFRQFMDLKKEPRHLVTVHHHYLTAAPEVEGFHEKTGAAIKQLWGPENQLIKELLGRGGIIDVGDTGNTMLDTPLIVHPDAAPEARAAMLVLSATAEEMKRAATDPVGTAYAMLRGSNMRGNRSGSERVVSELGGVRNLRRTEALLFDQDPEFIHGMAYAGGTTKEEPRALGLMKKYLQQFGREDAPIYRLRGPEGELPDMLPEELSPGRAKIVDEYTKLIDPKTGTNYTDIGAGIGPGAVGRMLAGAGSQTAAGAAMGGAAGFLSDDEDRMRGAAKGALGGAIGGAAFGKLAPEVGRAVATAYRNHAPDLVDDTIMSPEALAIAHRNAVKAQQDAGELPGAALKDLPRQVDDAWRAQVVNTFRGLALDASSLWLLVKDFGRDYGVDRTKVKSTLGELVKHYDDPDPIARLGKLGGTLKGWGVEDFVDEATSLDQVLGTSFSRADIGENKMSTPQRFLTGVGLSFTNLRDAMVPVVGPLIGGVRQVYAPYIDTAYRTLNGFQHAAPRIAFWDAALTRDLPRAADKFRATVAPTGIDLGPLFAGGKPVSPQEVGRYLTAKYKGLTPDEVGEFQSLYREALHTTAMESADRIAHIFGDFRDKSAKPWKTFLGRVFPFSRYAMQFAPVGLEMVKRHPVIAGATAAGLGASAYAVSQNEEAPWNAGSIPISTETPGLGALARLRLGGQSGTWRVDPLSNFTGPLSAETFTGGGLPTDTTYDKAKSLIGKVGFSPHPAMDAIASLTGQTNRNPGPMSRTAPIEQAAELVPGMPTVPSVQGAFNTAKAKVTGKSVDDFDPVARHYAEMVYERTGKPMSDRRNLEYLERMGDVDDPLWRRARQEVRLANLVGSLVSNLTPLSQTATGAGAERVSRGYADRVTDAELQELALSDPDAARVALYERNIKDRFDPVTRTYQMANTADRDRAVIRNWGPFANNPAVRELLLESQREELKRKDR